jgi:hypothetical protein
MQQWRSPEKLRRRAVAKLNEANNGNQKAQHREPG